MRLSAALPGAPSDAALDRLRAALDQAGRRPGARIALSVAVERNDPVALAAAAIALGEEVVLIAQPAAGRALVGIGTAAVIESDGADRFDRVARAWRELAGETGVEPGPWRPGSGPVLVGGFPFAPRRSGDPVWAGFECARLVVPAIGYAHDGRAASLAVTDIPEAVPGLVERWRAIGERTGDRADGGGSTTHSVPGRRAGLRDGRSPRLRPVGGTTRGEWLASVGRLSGAVGRGRIDKVVLARRLDLEADRPIDVAAALRRLAHGAPESTVFAVSRAGRTFLGATPERLVRLERGEVRTVALAGSIGRGATAAEDDALARALLASEKDREEHAVVVAMLREALEPLTAALVVEPRPSVVRLRHVQHLATGLRGVLREPLGVLDLVARLHPTPAVGGWPRELALELLAEEERIDRGWYAGPLGWVDRSGDGELVVAIRSAVVEGRRASLFAGCGIVADSDPELEWAESEMKLRAVASALGEIAR